MRSSGKANPISATGTPNNSCKVFTTGIVPPDEFSLQPGDEVVVGISGVGRLKNPVIAV